MVPRYLRKHRKFFFLSWPSSDQQYPRIFLVTYYQLCRIRCSVRTQKQCSPITHLRFSSMYLPLLEQIPYWHWLFTDQLSGLSDRWWLRFTLNSTLVPGDYWLQFGRILKRKYWNASSSSGWEIMINLTVLKNNLLLWWNEDIDYVVTRNLL